jgi:Sec-independent protein translocase protein TatA
MELSSIVSFAEKHPRALLIVLLGVIAAGSTGGGLWINSLSSAIEQNKNMLAEKDKQLDQKEQSLKEYRELLKGRYENKLAALRQENIYLTQQISVIKPLAQGIAAKLSEIEGAFSAIQRSPQAESNNIDRLPELVRSLDEQARDIRHVIDEMELISNLGDRIDQELGKTSTTASPKGFPQRLQRPWMVYYLLLSPIWLVPVILYITIHFARKRRDLKKWELALAEKEQKLRQIS